MVTQPLRIAHRGMPRLARENSIPSFTLALEAGADGIELDVHASRDGIVVVHHDASLANGRAIADATLAELRAAADVPALQEVCDLVRGRAELFVEVKGGAIEQLVLSVVRDYDGCFAIHSFDHGLIARLHAMDPSIRLGILFEETPGDVGALMASTGALDVWPHAPLVTQRLVDEIHATGGRVIAWTVNDTIQAARLASFGVDGLCGDDVGLLVTP